MSPPVRIISGASTDSAEDEEVSEMTGLSLPVFVQLTAVTIFTSQIAFIKWVDRVKVVGVDGQEEELNSTMVVLSGGLQINVTIPEDRKLLEEVYHI